MEEKYRLDRKLLKSASFAEADDHVTYWKNKSEEERLNAACFIINQIFDVTPSTKMNKSITDKRKHP